VKAAQHLATAGRRAKQKQARVWSACDGALFGGVVSSLPGIKFSTNNNTTAPTHHTVWD